MSTGVSTRRRATPAHATSVVLACLVLVALQVAARAWAVSGAWFQLDDLVLISRVSGRPWTWSLVTQASGGHLMPGGLSLTWLFTRADPLGFTPYAVTLAVAQAVASLGFAALLLSMFGRRPGVLVPLSLYLFSPLSFPAFVWWTAGIQELFLQIALTWGLVAHLRYLRTGRFRWVLTTMLVIVACLLFSEKVLLAYVAVVWLTMAYFVQGAFRHRLAELGRRHWRAGLVHGVVVIAYVAWYVGVAGSRTVDGADRSDLLSLTGTVLGQAWLPGLFGGPLRWHVVTGPVQLVAAPDLAVTVALLLAALVVGAISTSYARSWRAWTLPAAFAVLHVVAPALSGAGTSATAEGLRITTIASLALVTPLALGAACLPIVGAPEQVERLREHRFLDDRELVALATTLVCVLGVYSTVRYARHWLDSTESRTYLSGADRTLGSEQDPTVVADLTAPPFLDSGLDLTHTTTRDVLGMFGQRASYPELSLDHLYVVSDDGTAQPAQVTPSIPPVEQTQGQCLTQLDPSSTATIHLERPVTGDQTWAQLSYVLGEETPLKVTTGDTTRSITLGRGYRKLFLRLEPGTEELTLTRGGGDSNLCISDLATGLPVPLAPASGSS